MVGIFDTPSENAQQASEERSRSAISPSSESPLRLSQSWRCTLAISSNELPLRDHLRAEVPSIRAIEREYARTFHFRWLLFPLIESTGRLLRMSDLAARHQLLDDSSLLRGESAHLGCFLKRPRTGALRPSRRNSPTTVSPEVRPFHRNSRTSSTIWSPRIAADLEDNQPANFTRRPCFV